MPRACTVCQDPRRGALDVELRRSDRPSYHELADVFKGLGWQAIRRHERHVTPEGAEVALVNPDKAGPGTSAGAPGAGAPAAGGVR